MKLTTELSNTLITPAQKPTISSVDNGSTLQHVFSYLLDQSPSYYYSTDYTTLRTLAAVSKSFKAVTEQILCVTDTYIRGIDLNEKWIRNILKNKTNEKHPVNLINAKKILNRINLSVKLRLEFIDYFLNQSNTSTKESLSFLIFATNTIELFPIALPIIFRKLTAIGNVAECKDIFDTVVGLLESPNMIIKQAAIKTIPKILSGIEVKNKIAVFDKIIVFLGSEYWSIGVVEDQIRDTDWFIKIVIKSISQSFSVMKAEQQNECFARLIQLFETCNSNTRKAVLSGIIELFDKFERHQQDYAFSRILHFLSKMRSYDNTNHFLVAFLLPKIFAKMDREQRSQAFEDIVQLRNINSDDPMPQKLASIEILMMVTDTVELTQQIQLLNMIMQQTDETDWGPKYTPQLFIKITPIVFDVLEPSKRSEVFDAAMTLLKSSKTTSLDIATMMAELFDKFNATQKQQFFDMRHNFYQDSSITNIIFDHLTTQKKQLVFSELIELSFSNNSHLSERAIINLRKILERIPKTPTLLEDLQPFDRVTQLLEGGFRMKTSGVKILKIIFNNLIVEQRLTSFNQILEIYNDDYSEGHLFRRLWVEFIADNFGLLNEIQRTRAFEILLPCCNADVSDNLLLCTVAVQALDQISNKLTTDQQMQCFNTMLSICQREPVDHADYLIGCAARALATFVNKLDLTIQQQIETLTAICTLSQPRVNLIIVRTVLDKIPKIYRVIKDEAQRIRAFNELMFGTTHREDGFTGLTAITAIIEIFDDLNQEQKNRVLIRITAMLNESAADGWDSAWDVMDTILGIIPNIFNKIGKEAQSVIFNRVMHTYENGDWRVRDAILKSPVLFLNSHLDVSYSNPNGLVFFKPEKLAEYCNKIESTLTDATAKGNKKMRAVVA